MKTNGNSAFLNYEKPRLETLSIKAHTIMSGSPNAEQFTDSSESYSETDFE